MQPGKVGDPYPDQKVFPFQIVGYSIDLIKFVFVLGIQFIIPLWRIRIERSNNNVILAWDKRVCFIEEKGNKIEDIEDCYIGCVLYVF